MLCGISLIGYLHLHNSDCPWVFGILWMYGSENKLACFNGIKDNNQNHLWGLNKMFHSSTLRAKSATRLLKGDHDHDSFGGKILEFLLLKRVALWLWRRKRPVAFNPETKSTVGSWQCFCLGDKIFPHDKFSVAIRE